MAQRSIDEVNEHSHFIVQADGIRQADQEVGRRFGCHDDAPGDAFHVFPGEQKVERLQKASQFLDEQVVGVAERAVYVETQGADAGQVKGHGKLSICD